MRVTKSLAEQLSEKLLQKKYDAIEKLKKDLEEYVYSLALSTLPTEVIEFDKKFPGYIDRENRARFNDRWFEYRHTSFLFPEGKSLPLKTDYIEIEKTFLKNIEIKRNKIDQLDREYRGSMRIVGIAIFNLRTIDKVKKEFPEAAPFLPDSNQTTALAVNLDKIRDLIK